jgi:hypothetical protein
VYVANRITNVGSCLINVSRTRTTTDRNQSRYTIPIHSYHNRMTRRDGTALESRSCVNIKEREGRKEMDEGQKLAVSSVVDDGGRWPFAGRFILPCARAQIRPKYHRWRRPFRACIVERNWPYQAEENTLLIVLCLTEWTIFPQPHHTNALPFFFVHQSPITLDSSRYHWHHEPGMLRHCIRKIS